jgi:phosphatidate cytidylyltransferase
LVASAVKRNNNVKDFGNVIPGHGGILDRFDSVLFTAPTVYFMIVLFLVNK